MNRTEILAHCLKTYGTKPDFPWNDDNAVLRHTHNRRWYAVLLKVEGNKVGLHSTDIVDVLNVKCDPGLIGTLLKNEGYVPAYHMNKEKWISIVLDGCVNSTEIIDLIDLSYQLTI